MTPAQEAFLYALALIVWITAAAWGFRTTNIAHRLIGLVAVGLALVTLVPLWAAAEGIG